MRLRTGAVVAIAALAFGVSCTGASVSRSAAVRGACGDAETVKREVIAMRRKQVTRAQTLKVLTAATERINERAEADHDGWRLRDLVASIDVMRTTVAHHGDEGAASSDVGVVRGALGCD